MGPSVKVKRHFLRYFWKGLGYFIQGVFRVFGLFFLLVFLLIVVGYLGLRVAVNDERVKAVFVAQIQEIVHRPVQIEKVLLTPRGIKLKGLRVLAGPDMPGRDLLTSDTVLATVKLSALLRRRVEFEQVKLIAPTVELVRDEDGRWSVEDIVISSRAAEAPPASRFLFSISLAADRTVLSQGVVRVEDQLRHRQDLCENVNVEIERFDLDRPFSYSLSGAYTGTFSSRTVHGVLQAQGIMSLSSGDLSKVVVRANRIRLVSEGKGIHGSGGFVGFEPSHVDADLFLSQLGPEDIKKIFGSETKFTIPAGRWRLKATRVAPKSFRIDQVSLESQPFSAAAQGVVDLGKGALQGALSVSDFPLQQVGILYPPWQRLGLRGTVRAEAEVSGPFSDLKLRKASLRAQGVAGQFKNFALDEGNLSLSVSDNLDKWAFSVTDGRGRIFSAPFSRAFLTAALHHDDLRLDRLSLSLIGSRVDLKVRVRHLSNPKEVMIEGKVDRVCWEDAQALVSEFVAHISTNAARVPDNVTWLRQFKYSIPKSFPDTVGHVVIGAVSHKNFSMNAVDMLWDVHGVSPSLKRVSGDVVVSFGPGRVNDIPSLQAANAFLRIIFLPFVYMHKMNNLSVFSAATAYPKTLDFNRIEGDYSLRQGVVDTRLFYVDSPQMVAYTDGWGDFAKETVDLDIMTRLTGYREPLPEWWVDALGRPAISFKVKGNLNLPDLEPRLTKMAGDEIEKALAEARAEAKKRTGVFDKLRRW